MNPNLAIYLTGAPPAVEMPCLMTLYKGCPSSRTPGFSGHHPGSTAEGKKIDVSPGSLGWRPGEPPPWPLHPGILSHLDKDLSRKSCMILLLIHVYIYIVDRDSWLKLAKLPNITTIYYKNWTFTVEQKVNGVYKPVLLGCKTTVIVSLLRFRTTHFCWGMPRAL